MNKKELINEIASKTDLTKKEIDAVLTLILEIIMDKVSLGERVRLVGFGSFYKIPKNASLHFVEDESIYRKLTVKFSPGKFFKQRINVRN